MIYALQVHWHPFFLNPTAPKEGVDKREYYRNKFGARAESIVSRMHEVRFLPSDDLFLVHIQFPLMQICQKFYQ